MIVWFYNIFMILNWNSEKKSWKFLENFSFYQNFQFSGSTTLYISCHNLAELWPRTKIFSPKYPSMIPLKVSCRHTYGNSSRLGDIGKDIRGVKLTPLGVYVDQKTLVFPELILYDWFLVYLHCLQRVLPGNISSRRNSRRRLSLSRAIDDGGSNWNIRFDRQTWVCMFESP